MTKHLLSLCLAVVMVVGASCSPPPPTDVEVQAATAQPLGDGTYAGKTSNENLFAAVITSSAGVEAYLCDGTVDFWFRGEGASDSVMSFGAEGEPRLLLQLADGSMQGRLVAVDGSETLFELPAVNGEVLFRADSFAGEEPVLGGWIKLPSGEQRGLIRVGDARVPSDLGADLRANCAACVVNAGLVPAPFTPAAATRRPNTQQRVTIIGLGDSYMSGEGAPVVEGDLRDNGNTGTQEQWSNGLPTPSSFSFNLDAATRTRLSREARACHRGAAGLGLAVDELRRSWPFATLIHQTFACSGAQVKHAIDTNYGGPGGCESLSGSAKDACLVRTDDLNLPTLQPQLPEAIAFLRAQQLTPDAVVMSLGGNDLGFGDIIADCLGSPGKGCEAADSEARNALSTGSAALPGRYDRLATALSNASIPDSAIFLTSYLSPLRNTATDMCAGLEFDDALLRFIADEEAAFAGSVHTTMNGLGAAAATRNGWRLINSHVGSEVGHAMCNGSSAWFNDTATALRTQGEDLVSPFPGIGISAGMVHPNKRGHAEGYKPAYVAALDGMLRTRFKPKAPQNLRVIAMALENGRGRVTITWDDMNTFESFTNVRDANGRKVTGVRADVNTAEVLLDGTTGTFRLEACIETPDLCSNLSAPLDVDVKRPTVRPIGVKVEIKLQASNANPRALRLTWDDEVPERMFSTVEMEIGTTTTRVAVGGQEHLLPETTALKRFRVAACNSLGCGPASDWVEFDRPAFQVRPPCENPRLNGCRQ